jgi:small conductance mechanosensitive channel
MEDQTYVQKITEMAIEFAPSVLIAILTLIIGFWIIGWITKILEKTLRKKGFDASVSPFLVSLVNVGLKVLLLLSVASKFGVETTSFIAILGAMAFAVGLALQGSLGNFASGVMILLFKPYNVGDVIEAQGKLGKVIEIQIFNTIMLTGDNKKIIIPNAIVTSGAITNISGQGELRVDMTYGIGYSDDIDKARRIIQEVVDSCPEIIKEKPVDIFVSALADSSVNFAVRPWSKSENYWKVYFYMHENVKKEFDKQGVSIPFPQMDVHTHSVN